MKRWTPAEMRSLAEMYSDAKNATLASVFGVTEPAIVAKACKLGLHKSEAFRREHGCRTGFRPGLVPWNRGLPHAPGGRSAAAHFKPGNRPQTWVPVGSTRVTKDGYLQRKVTDTGRSASDWRAVHALVWEAANGPIPRGHVVVFKPGRKTTNLDAVTAASVDLVSRADLMRRNSVHNYPPEIARLVQLRGALNRQINARSKET